MNRLQFLALSSALLWGIAASGALPGRSDATPIRSDPIRLDGQTLDPGIQAFLQREKAKAENGKIHVDVTTAQGRKAIRDQEIADWRSTTAIAPDMRSVANYVVPRRGVGLQVRVYRPIARGRLPIFVYYHGGGWFVGGIEASDRSSRQLANDAKAIVVSVEYRLAPEFAYPAAWADAEAAYAWTINRANRLGGSRDDVCVAGDSAGGNMAIATTIRRVKKGEAPPLCQILYYPAVDMRSVDTMRAIYTSSRLFGEGFRLDRTFMDYISQIVFPGRDLADPEISPLLGASRKMPPTLVAVAGFDPLRDSQRAYAAKLAQAGNNLIYFEFPSLIHGFLQHSAITPEAARASRVTAQAAGTMARNAMVARAVHAAIPISN